jgi:GT2 family glycosyltransferase
MTGATQTDASRILDAYPEWVRAHDTLDEADHAAIATAVASLLYRPLISLIVPAGDGIDSTIASLRDQIYPRWQAIVVGAASTPSDRRVETAAAPPGFAAACAAGLAAAAGAFVAILRPGDRLPPHAIYEIAADIGRAPDTDLLYTDEDTIDAAGARAAPRFKPGWDADLLLAFDYIGGLALYRRDLLERIAPPRGVHPAAVLYDLALRATDATMPDRIRHLSRVLLHRPAAGDAPAPDEMRAVAQESLGPSADVSETPHGHRIAWNISIPAPLVSIIVPTRDRAALLTRCAEGVLRRTDYPALELLVIDNDSAEPATHAALLALARDDRVRVLHHAGPFNYSALNNRAVRAARGEVVVLLNNDTEITEPGWLRELVSHARRPEVGAVGAKLRYADGSIQHGGIVLAPGQHAAHLLRLAAPDDPGYFSHSMVARNVLAVTAACLAIRREVFLEAGGFDDENLPVAFNDVDLCLRLRELGYRVVWTPHADLLHLESQTRGRPTTEAGRAREQREIRYLRRSWRHLFDRDPFLNENFVCLWETPLQLCPPRREQPWRRASRLGRAA